MTFGAFWVDWYGLAFVAFVALASVDTALAVVDVAFTSGWFVSAACGVAGGEAVVGPACSGVVSSKHPSPTIQP